MPHLSILRLQDIFLNAGPFTQLVELAGGTPLLLPPVADPAGTRAFWPVLDGLLLPGGSCDVHPAAYGEEPHPLLGTVDEAADHLELNLVHEGLSWDLPVLAINRGMQVLNVALGGTLYQDLAAELGGGTWHHVTTHQPRTYLAHPVSIVRGTHLADLMGEESLLVNSFHHQGIKTLGQGIRVAGLAPDDVIEAIELPDRRFVLGVQFSLEALALDGDQRMLRLFQHFIEAASIYGGERCRNQMQARRVMERLEGMWTRDLAVYEQQHHALFGEAGTVGALEELELRQALPVLRGRLQAIAEALGRADVTPPVRRS